MVLDCRPIDPMSPATAYVVTGLILVAAVGLVVLFGL